MLKFDISRTENLKGLSIASTYIGPVVPLTDDSGVYSNNLVLFEFSNMELSGTFLIYYGKF